MLTTQLNEIVRTAAERHDATYVIPTAAGQEAVAEAILAGINP